MRKFLQNSIFPLAGLASVLLLEIRSLVVQPGYLIYRDLFPGQLFYPSLWHPKGSFLALENYKFLTYTAAFLPLRIFGLEVYEKAVYLSVWFVAYLAFYVAFIRLLPMVASEDPPSWVRRAAGAIGALFYVSNPAAANIFFDFSLFVGYAFAPLTLWLYMELLEGKRRLVPGVLLAAGSWWLSAIKAHWIVFGALSFGPPFIAWAVHTSRQLTAGRRLFTARLSTGLAMTASIGLVYLLLSAYWLLPFLQAREGRFVGSFAPLTLESIDTLSRTPMVDTVRMLGSYPAWPYVVYEPPHAVLAFPWFLVSWMIPLLVVIGFISYRKTWVVMAWGLFAVAGIFLSKGTAPPLGELYRFLVFGPLTPDAFRWLFRVASKWNVFLSIGYSFLLGLAVYRLMRDPPRLRRWWKEGAMTVSAGVAAVILLLYSFFAWPSFTGNFRRALEPVELPGELISANQWLADQGGNEQVTWIPVTNGRELSWNRRPSGDLYTSISPLDSIATNWNRHPVLYYSYAFQELVNGHINSFGKLLSILQTRYLVYHADISTSHVHEGVEPVSVLIEEGEEEIPDRLAGQQDMKLEFESGFISIYSIRQPVDRIFVPERTFLSTGDLTDLTRLSGLLSFQPAQNAIIFSAVRSRSADNASPDGLILDLEAQKNLAFSFLPETRIIPAGRATLHGDPTENWARLDIFQFDWQAVLHSYNIDSWGFDFDQGMAVFTDEFHKTGRSTEPHPALMIPVYTTEPGNYHLWLRSLDHRRAATLQIEIDGEPFGTVNSPGDKVNFTWKDCGSIHLEAGKHIIALRSYFGLSAVNALALLTASEMDVYEQKARELAERVDNLYFLEAETDFSRSFIEDSAPSDTLNSGHAVVIKSGEHISAHLSVVAGGEYQLALRAATAAITNTVSVHIDGRELLFHPRLGGGRLEWLGHSSIHLPAGEVKILIHSDQDLTLDAMILYRGSQALDPDNFLGGSTPPATVHYQQVDPTRYNVHVEARKPFYLGLSTTYDPLWTAKSADFNAGSVPLYGVINGFYIPKTGSFDLTIDYQPQQAARLGQLISAAIVLICGFVSFAFVTARKQGSPRTSEPLASGQPVGPLSGQDRSPVIDRGPGRGIRPARLPAARHNSSRPRRLLPPARAGRGRPRRF